MSVWSEENILKIEQSEIPVHYECGDFFFWSGKLNLFGKELAVEDAKVLVDSGFTFEGENRNIINPEQNTLNYLRPLGKQVWDYQTMLR